MRCGLMRLVRCMRCLGRFMLGYGVGLGSLGIIWGFDYKLASRRVSTRHARVRAVRYFLDFDCIAWRVAVRFWIAFSYFGSSLMA